MLVPVTHILPLTTIRRKRLLPVPGKVIVRKGQGVSATDTIAETSLSPEHILLDISRGLGLSPEKADENVSITVGAQVAEGDLIAGPVGLARRVVRAPKKGRVVITGDGQVLLEVQSSPYVLVAGIPGEVVELIPDRGAVIEATGALIQGAWGNGQTDSGMMNVLAKEPGHLITRDQLDVSYRGSVLIAGLCNDVEVLKAAAELPLRGLVLASMHPALIPVAIKLRIPVMLTEGFGQRPMNSAAFKLLTTSEQRHAALNAEMWDPYQGTRPELIIPLPAPNTMPVPSETATISPGQQVRVLRAPHAGKIGTLTGLREVVALPNGVRTQAAEIHLEDGSEAVLPVANLEVMQ